MYNNVIICFGSRITKQKFIRRKNMDKFFKISERGSNIKTEIIAGLTTFFAMAYIVFVNPNQVAAEGANGWLTALGAPAGAMGQIWNSVFVASIIAAVVGTLLYAFYAKMPFAQACGMGLNSFFCTCFVSGAYFSGVDVIRGYHSGMVIVFLSGILFLLLTITGARSVLARAMPDCLKRSISAGIGLFIAFIGFQNVGIIQTNQYTLVQFVNINSVVKGDAAFITIMPALVALLGFIIIAILAKKNVKGNVIIGILATTVIYYALVYALRYEALYINFDIGQVGQAFRDFGEVGIKGLFSAESWKDAFTADHNGGIFNAIVLIITFAMVDMFDTIGTLYGTASEADMLDENGDPIDMNKCMNGDAISTVAGAVCGTSTCTTFVESASGVAAGGRTGFASLVTAICFALCLFLTPVASIIPSAATAPALIWVGVLMLKNFGKVDMKDIRSAVPAFLVLVMMPLTYSISNGIGIGAIAYVLITLFTGEYKKKDIPVTVIALLFVAKFVFGAI